MNASKIKLFNDYDIKINEIKSDIKIAKTVTRLYKKNGGDYKNIYKNFSGNIKLNYSFITNKLSHIDIGGTDIKGDYKTILVSTFNVYEHEYTTQAELIDLSIKRFITIKEQQLKQVLKDYKTIDDRLYMLDSEIMRLNEIARDLTTKSDKRLLLDYIINNINL